MDKIHVYGDVSRNDSNFKTLMVLSCNSLLFVPSYAHFNGLLETRIFKCGSGYLYALFGKIEKRTEKREFLKEDVI